MTEITYFYGLTKPSAFGVQSQTLLYNRIEISNIQKTRIVPGKQKGM
jgi:hypothetical protein